MFTCEKEIFKCTSVILRTQAETEAEWMIEHQNGKALSAFILESRLGDTAHFNCGSVYYRSQASHPSLDPGSHLQTPGRERS